MLTEMVLVLQELDRRYVYDKYNLYNISGIKLN